MTKRLLLHIGPHKTGTTSIQHALKVESDALLSGTGWTYQPLSDVMGGVHNFADMLSTGQFDAAQPFIDALKATPMPCVMSSENFSRLNEPQVRHLVDALGDIDIRVVYYMRNPGARLLSAWRERVKHGYRFTLVEFLAGRLLRPFLDREFNEAVKIAPWVDVLGIEAIDLHLYDAFDNATTHFFETYFPGLGRAPKTVGMRTNRSPGAAQTETLRALAGYQVHLFTHGEFRDRVADISGRIDAINADQDDAYLRTLSFTLDTPILYQLERSVIARFGDAVRQPLPSKDMLFAERNVDWRYVAPEIWFEQADLTGDVLALRQAIHDTCGVPVFDSRLAQL
jgi:hypothetical protein